tara:strand:- start:396 stop:638 length:243 start_codon:yes stop_codon:yes gene_type:complete
MSKEIDNKNKREVTMTMTFNENLGFQFEKFISDEICINGINGIPNILDMIMDRIDDGDTDGAKDDIRQLQVCLLENNVRG